MEEILKELLEEMKELKSGIAGIKRDIFGIKTEVLELRKYVTEQEITGLKSKENMPDIELGDSNIFSLDEPEIKPNFSTIKLDLTDMNQSINIIGNGLSELKNSTRLMWNDVKRMDKTLGKQEVSIRQLAREL